MHKTQRQGYHRLTIDIPLDYWIILKKVSVESGLTLTSIVIQYIKYLQGRQNKKRFILDEHKDSDFELGPGKPK